MSIDAAQKALKSFGLQATNLVTLNDGLIHHTWKVDTTGGSYILQRVNTNVFRKPEDIARNIRLVGDYLQQNFPGYLFVRPCGSLEGTEVVNLGDAGCFRLFPFVAGSHTVDAVQTPGQAYEAAKQFGRFTRLLAGFDAGQLSETIPHFHDLELRYCQFEKALKTGNVQRIAGAQKIIESLAGKRLILDRYKAIVQNGEVRLRVTHHDTKISNVLFDEHDKGLCVIDLDTVMPGYFISDVGDMMRTYLSPVSEEEGDLSRITVRVAFYKAVVEGYASEMRDILTATEKGLFFFAGQFMVYMQALRFLTDYLNNDVYYGARYKEQNLVRTANQLALLEELTGKKEALEACIAL